MSGGRDRGRGQGRKGRERYDNGPLVRFQCDCGRSLFDVVRPHRRAALPWNPDWTVDDLSVYGRAGVTVVMHERRTSPEDGNKQNPTYTVHCHCGQTHSRRHDRIGAAWSEWHGARGEVVRVCITQVM